MIDSGRIKAWMKALGSALAHPTKLYLMGGASAVLAGWRESTREIDCAAVPDREFERLKHRFERDFGIPLVVTAPDRFIPEVPGWEERSPAIGKEGRVSFFHMDFYSQALSKIERASARDPADVRAMIDRGLLAPQHALELFAQIEPAFAGYPAIDGPGFRRQVEIILAGAPPGG